MKCIYINLDSAETRRKAIEENFARFAPSHWTLRRFSAVNQEAALARGNAGALTTKEKACFLSHMDVIAECASSSEPFLVLEDDALFGPNSCDTLERSVAHLNSSVEWDILFPDLCIAQIGIMADLFLLRRQLLASNRTRLMNPKGIAFSSATSYVLHPRAARKIIEDAPASLDIPYDLFLRRLVNVDRLVARYIFPFAMCLEETSNASTIQPGSDARTGFIWYLFRRMVWRDGGVEQHLGDLAQLAKDLSVEAKAFAVLWAAMADPSFRPK